MRHLFIIPFILLLASCAKHEGYTISGTVPEAWEGKRVYLTATDVAKPYNIDSTVISDGKFKLQGKVDEPRFCDMIIYLDANETSARGKLVKTSLFVDNSTIDVMYDALKKNPEFVITGGVTNAEYQEVSNKALLIDNDRRKMFSDYASAYYSEHNLPKAIELANELAAKQREIRQVKIDYINENPESVVSIKLSKELVDRNSDLSQEEINNIFNSLSNQLQNSEMGQSLKEIIDNRKVFIGAPFIDYALVTPDSQTKNIADFVKPGNTTLIEFWASWCAPCRQEIPYMKKTYEKYHPKGLNILSISIDADKESWLKALEEEKLPWGQLLDQKSDAFREYNLLGVPSSILVDHEGNIIHVNARGGWLDAMMQEIYD